MIKIKIKKGDIVKIIKGKDRGKEGKVTEVNDKTRKLFVEGLNLFKKHARPRKQGEKGEIVQVMRPIPIANVMLVCPSCKKAVRIGALIENDTKVRICKKCRVTL